MAGRDCCSRHDGTKAQEIRRRLIIATLIVLPVLEVAVFVLVAGAIGLWATLAVVLVSGVAGYLLWVRWWRAFTSRCKEVTEKYGSAEKFPYEVTIANASDLGLSFIAGLCLLSPGFLSDVFGLILYLPPVRKAIEGWILESERADAARHGLTLDELAMVRKDGCGCGKGS